MPDIPPPADDPRPGAVARGTGAGLEFGPFRLQEPLGSGAWTTVYDAVDTRTGYQLALKIWSPLRSSAEQRSRAWAMAERAHRLERLTGVNVHDVGEVRGVPYVAYRTTLEASLADVIDAHGALDPDVALRLVATAAATLEQAHANAEWHGRVSPSNLLVDDLDLTRARVHVSDFSVPPVDALDRDPYSAPEWNDGAPVDARADVYSLAATAYALLTGVPAIGPVWIDGVFQPWHDGDVPRRLRELRPDLPEALDDLLGRALDPRRDVRPATVAQFTRELHQAWADAPVEQPVPVNDEPGPTFTLPEISKRTMVVGVGVVLVALLFGGGFGWWRSAQRDDAAKPEPTTTIPVDPTVLAEQRLRATVPGLQCEPEEIEGVDSVAAVSCRDEASGITVQLAELASENPTQKVDEIARRDSDVREPEPEKRPEPTCKNGDYREWSYDNGFRGGVYHCSATDRTARVYWSVERGVMLGIATRSVNGASDNATVLNDWWFANVRPQLAEIKAPPTTTLPVGSPTKGGR